MATVSLWVWQERFKSRWQGSAVQAFIHAWGRELRDSLPFSLRRALRPGREPQPCFWPLPAELALMRDASILLQLPHSAVLIQRLALPLAAARDLSRVMSYELDRFTPFTPDQVHYIVRREGIEAGQVWLTLVLVPKPWLDRCLEDCRAHGLQIHAIDVLDEQGRPLGINLLPRELGAPADARLRRLAASLGLLGALMLITVPMLWLHNREAALTVMQAQVQTLRRSAGEVSALRKTLDETRRMAQFLLKHRQAQPSRALLLNELTRCLPGDTWLQSLEINAAGQIDMAGLSARASTLIGQIKTCTHLADIQYQGVIQPDEASGRDRFYIRARARGEGADEANTDTP